MYFLFDKNQGYTYEDLLLCIKNSKEYYPLYKTNDLFSYFVNLISAMLVGKDVVLLDSDINPSELKDIDVEQINNPVKITLPQINSINDVIEIIKETTSKIILFTSGTTGQPKKVTHSIPTLTRSVRCGDKYQGQIWAYAYNPTHMAGLQVFFQAFENKNTLVNVFNQSREFIYEQIHDKKITHISATPTFYRLLLPFEKSYKNVNRITLGGEKSDKHLYDTISKIFPNAKINNVYASTEAGSLFATKDDCFQIPLSIKDKFKVENDELLIHKSLLGYSDSFNFSNDFYHSGDLIEWVNKEEGLFKFKSRKNELINIGGYKVNPNEVEDAIMSMSGVQQVVVYGKANSILGNVLCADIILVKGDTINELDVKKYLSLRLQDFKIPRRIKFVNEISLTRTGKLKRK